MSAAPETTPQVPAERPPTPDQGDERYRRMRDDLERDYPAPWLPEPGDEILGALVAVRDGVPTKFGPVAVAELALEPGRHVSVWLHHAVLRRAFARAAVQLGEVVLIRYVGRTEAAGGGNPYHDYRLAVDRPDPSGPVDWQAISAAHDDELEAPTDANGAGDPGPVAGDPGPEWQAEPTDDIPF